MNNMERISYVLFLQFIILENNLERCQKRTIQINMSIIERRNQLTMYFDVQSNNIFVKKKKSSAKIENYKVNLYVLYWTYI